MKPTINYYKEIMNIELLFFAPILIGLAVAGSQNAIRFFSSLDNYIKEMK